MPHTDSTALAAKPRPHTVAAAGLLALALGTTALSVFPPAGGNAQTGGQTPDGRAVALPRAPGRDDFADLAERVAPAVVRVTVLAGRAATKQVAEVPHDLRGAPLEELFRRFNHGGGRGEHSARPPRGPGAVGQGSGFIVDPQGYVVTNRHVVGEADRATVELADGRKLEARVLATDPQTDLAVLKLDAGSPLPSIEFGDSGKVRAGEAVLAMGNPFGLGATATAGTVSARGRQIGAGPSDDFIQTDAAINPGNSGGPLFNGKGEVIGVNTAIISPSGGNVGIGFAIPSDLAKRVVTELRDGGRVERGWLGVSLQPLDEELAGVLGAPDGKGALIASVEPDSPAARGGLKPGDIVIGVAGKAVQQQRDLAVAVADAKPGSTVAVSVLRNGRRVEQQVAVGEPPGLASRTEADGGQQNARQGPLGLSLVPHRGDGAGRAGVLVAGVAPGSAAEERGLRSGDVILSVGDRAAATPHDVAGAVDAARNAGRPGVAVQIERGESRTFVALPFKAA